MPSDNISTSDIISLKGETKAPQRVIGIVKFFDSLKGWGFVVSGNKGISGKAKYEGKLLSLHLASSEWHGSSSPRKREWILLTPCKTPLGWNALNAEPMECNRETLMLAMKYRGKYAKIHGIDNKGESFNENILCHIIKGMVIESIVKHPFGHYDTSKFPEVIDCFCEYVGDAPVERQEASVLQFLSDPALNDLLFKIFLEGDYMPVNGIRRDTHSLFIRLLTKQVFESGKLSELSKLPATFDYTPYIGGLTGILVNEAVQDTEAVAHWLTSHDVSSLLTLDETDFNTIPL